MIKSYFPIIIKIVSSGQVEMVKNPEDLPINTPFVITSVTLQESSMNGKEEKDK